MNAKLLDNVLSPGEYTTLKGHRCPACAAKTIDGDSPEIDGVEVISKCRCLTCEATWYDVYRLVSYDNLILPESQ